MTTITLAPTIQCSATVNDGTTVIVALAYHRDSRRYRMQNITVTDIFRPISYTDVRSMNLRSALIPKIRQQLADNTRTALLDQGLVKGPLQSFFTGNAGRPIAAAAAADPSSTHLDTAAAIHVLATSCGEYPVKAIERCFGISRTDALRWMRRVRPRIDDVIITSE